MCSLQFLWGQDGIFTWRGKKKKKKKENFQNFPERQCRKESNLQLLLMDKCQYSNLCFTDDKWKINIVSDGFVWMAEMKLCSDSPMCLSRQRKPWPTLRDAPSRRLQGKPASRMWTPRSFPQRGTVIRRCLKDELSVSILLLPLLGPMLICSC